MTILPTSWRQVAPVTESQGEPSVGQGKERFPEHNAGLAAAAEQNAMFESEGSSEPRVLYNQADSDELSERLNGLYAKGACTAGDLQKIHSYMQDKRDARIRQENEGLPSPVDPRPL